MADTVAIVVVLLIIGAVVGFFIGKRMEDQKKLDEKYRAAANKQREQLREPEPNSYRVFLEPIFGEKPEKDSHEIITKVVGVTFDNIDGSSRQQAIKRLKVGDRVQLVMNPNDPYDKNAIMVFGKGSIEHVEIPDCIGHLKADLAADVHDWAKDDSLEGIYAEVHRLTGGTRDKPTRGCVIKMMIY